VQETADKKMIGLAEAAALHHIPYGTAHRNALTGVWPAEKIGGRWFVPLEAVRLSDAKRGSR
jgi:hypothetical protein